MDQRVKRTQRDYTLAFQLAAVAEVEKGQLTYRQAQAKYGIQGRSMALVWLRKHGRQGCSPDVNHGNMQAQLRPPPAA